ncbi:MAG: glycosyltransferase [Gluconacetobacter diazotrophicus]|nr:glycosyltransferase [Gluconacetobacter diazotrophicus]
MSRIWIDVESLFQYAAASPRPSGIQRLELEIGAALAASPAARERVGFVRHARLGVGLRSVPYAAFAALHDRLAAAPTVTAGPAEVETAGTDPAAGVIADPGRLRRLLYRLPPDLRGPLATAAKGQFQAVRGVASLRGPLLRRLRRRDRSGGSVAAVPDAETGGGDEHAESFAALVRPGDALLMLGATWPKPEVGAFAAELRRRHGLRLGVLVYDVIPLLRPEWCGRAMEAQFRHWLRTLLPQADMLFTISDASARDLGAAARAEGAALPAAVRVLPVGTGFGEAAGEAAAERRTPDPRPAHLPAPGSYVLTVCTVDPRKNHGLLLRVWRRLLAELPRASVPTLVIAGKIGPMVDDLLQQLRNADWLGGKVALVREPSDAEVEALYRGCLFTVFPSFYEGWGLPVTESLGFGRPCLASNASSLPEAGGAMARYFDPENGAEAFRMIREAIEDRAGTEAWAARVRTEFRPVPWSDTADAILQTVDAAGSATGAAAAPMAAD